jgi:O-antigen ligase-like membrane protein
LISKNKLGGVAVFFYPLAEIATGYIYGYEPSKLITNLYVIFLLIFVAILKGGELIRSAGGLVWALLTFFAFWLVLLGFRGELRVADLTLVARSIVFGFVIYLFFCNWSRDELSRYLTRFFIFWWVVVTLGVFLGGLLGFGLYTYETFEAGNKFYFQATNELSIFYSSAVVFCYLKSSSTLVRLLLVVSSLMTFFSIGVKSFVISLFVVFFYFLIVFANRISSGSGWKTWAIVAPSVLLLGVLFVNMESAAIILVDVVADYSSAAGKIENKVKSVGVVSAALGERDVLLQSALEIVWPKMGWLDCIFGMGFDNYANIYGQGFGGEFRFVENDAADIFFSFGLVGLGIYLYFFMKCVISFLYFDNRSDALYRASIVTCLNILLLGVMSGHGVIFSLPALLVGCLCALKSMGLGEGEASVDRAPRCAER